jgi:hypothetical protein
LGLISAGFRWHCTYCFFAGNVLLSLFECNTYCFSAVTYCYSAGNVLQLRR